MRKAIFMVLMASCFTAHAQVYKERIGFVLESIENIDIGWMKMYRYSTPPKGKQLGSRVYSANQIDYSQQFIQWMQQSYLPKGCLGDAGYYQNVIPQFSGTNSLLGNEINTHRNALPQLYGAYAKMYMYLKKDAVGKFVPQNNYAEYWNIEANQLEHISIPVSIISSADEYYFMLPGFNGNAKGYDADDKAASNLKNFGTHKNIAAYKHFYIPPKTIDDFPHYIVIITKDNKPLPFEKVTIGEFFTQVEKRLSVWQKVTEVSTENLAKAQKNLARLKEKYKHKWNDVAELQLSTQIDIWSFINATEDHNDFFDNKDIYGKEGIHTSFPILKVSKAAKEDCKTDQPQWLVVRWTMGMPNQQYCLHLHESILNNFNFEYLYNFFFDAEEVKGQPYKPLHSPLYKEAAAIIEPSATSKKNATDKYVYFYEDFSVTAAGKQPTGWRTQYGLSEAGTIKKLDGLDGNWIIMAGNQLKVTQLKSPLPQDFTLSYDLVASTNFAWGAKSLTLLLAKQTTNLQIESFVSLRLRPGFDGRNGVAGIETKFPFPPAYSSIANTMEAPGFSNNKKNNLVTVTIKKTGETLQVFVDKTKIAQYEKAIPAAHLFNFLSFDSGGNSGENDVYYISNIKIVKE